MSDIVPPQYNTYTTPLTTRYASKEMCSLFSPATRHKTWRKLWLDLARAEKELGLEIPDEAITQMENHLTLTLQDWKTAEQEEKVRRYIISLKRLLMLVMMLWLMSMRLDKLHLLLRG